MKRNKKGAGTPDPTRIYPVRFPPDLWRDLVDAAGAFQAAVGVSISHGEYIRSAVREKNEAVRAGREAA